MSIQFYPGSQHCAVANLPSEFRNAPVHYCYSQGYELVEVLDRVSPDICIVLIQPIGSDQLKDLPMSLRA